MAGKCHPLCGDCPVDAARETQERLTPAPQGFGADWRPLPEPMPAARRDPNLPPGLCVPTLGPCTYGVPREHCHAGCGTKCDKAATAFDSFEARTARALAITAACCGGCELPAGHPPCGTNPKGSTCGSS